MSWKLLILKNRFALRKIDPLETLSRSIEFVKRFSVTKLLRFRLSFEIG